MGNAMRRLLIASVLLFCGIQPVLAAAKPDISGWIATAVDKSQPEALRVAAMREIGGAMALVRPRAQVFRPLLEEYEHPDLRKITQNVLLAVADAAMAGKVVAECRVETDPFGAGEFWKGHCLSRVAAFGDGALPYANLILTTFANAPNGADRSAAAAVLGYIGYRPAVAKLTAMLDDPDWRVTYAAVRSLGWLGAKDELPALNRIARTHWLEAVRVESRVAIAALQSRAGALSRPAVIWPDNLDYQPIVREVDVGVDAAPDVEPCASGIWNWRGLRFSPRGGAFRSASVGGGTMLMDRQGEWNSALIWRVAGAPDQVLNRSDVGRIEPVADGAIATFWDESGYFVEDGTLDNFKVGQFGYALHLTRQPGGVWRSREIARFPASTTDLTALAQDLYVATSGNRAVMFSGRKILGLAECIAK